MVDWPEALSGVKLLTGVNRQRTGAKIRSENEVGPANVRRRFTTAIQNVSFPVVMTDDEHDVFEAFYINDLDEGVKRFNWIDPGKGGTVSLRFRGVEGPAWQSSDGGDAIKWFATFDMEILP